MLAQAYENISVREMEDLFDGEAPDNEDPGRGYALINVLSEEAFAEEHIPQSANIPPERFDAFEQRYDKDKRIVVYDASLDGDASPRAAEWLADRGFTRVSDFREGLHGWKQAGNAISGRKAEAGAVV